jgi:hypothetical protein
MKNIILILFVFVMSASYAQQHATSNTHCQLEVDDILRQQSFEIDDPVSEDARYIFFAMYEDLNLIYTTGANDPQLTTYIERFEETLEKAAALNLNITMFDEDIEHVNTITH